jgi:hypothetical protein
VELMKVKTAEVVLIAKIEVDDGAEMPSGYDVAERLRLVAGFDRPLGEMDIAEGLRGRHWRLKTVAFEGHVAASRLPEPG